MFAGNQVLDVAIVVGLGGLLLWNFYLSAALARSRDQTKMAIDVSDRGRRFNQASTKTIAIMTRNSRKLMDCIRQNELEAPLLEFIPASFDVAELDAEFLGEN